MISVIIPVYNTGKYLKRCLESILDSSFRDFEVILVNDGSTDNSLQICRRYGRRDCRIRIMDQEHKGVSEARNKGIRESKGEWIVFVDSDDMISRDFLQTIAQDRFRGQELLIFDFVGTQKKTAVFQRSRCRRAEVCYGKGDMAGIIESMLYVRQLKKYGNVNLYSPCAKAYRSAVIKEHAIKFPPGLAICEDRIFNVEYFLETGSCTYIPKAVYYAQRRRGSATHSFHPDYLQQDLRFRRKLKSVLEKKDQYGRLETAYYENALGGMADVLIRGIFHPDSTRTWRENRSLCRRMRESRIYSRALKYNGKTGRPGRRAVLWFFRMRCYGIVRLMSKISYVALEGSRGRKR